ncbi:type 2 periplasmic-binding domain-containing protein [Nocardioides ultimimeridianus]
MRIRIALALGLSGLAGLAPLAVLPTGATASPAPHRAAGTGGVTVPAPGAGTDATVTVSRTTGLVNQTVAVSWKGFRPSSATRLQNAGDSLDTNTENPVRVYECRGADPASSSDCYGSPGFRGVPASDTTEAIPAVPAFTYAGQTDPFAATPDGPANWQDVVTSPDGTGEASIQVFTKNESAGLGCSPAAPCSIVVVPNYGRGDRSIGDTEDLMDAPWAWARRVVVPLSFQPVNDTCPLSGSSLPVEGSPMAAQALASWRARTCTLSSGKVSLDYTAIGEPQTRSDVASSSIDAGLTIDPLDKAKAEHVVYAPVAVTGLVIAFQVDDANGKPVTHMKLDPRLVAKLITASYRSGADPAVIHNRPYNLFSDPEFKALNPGVDWPGGAPGNHVLLLGDISDTTSALTRWIASDKDARDFLAGHPDPWGMTVNSNYAKLALPITSFPLLDPDLSNSFAPVQELDALSRQLSIAQFPGGMVEQVGGVNVTVKQPRQNPGSREVIGIIDAASAQRFRLATASLENSSGRYVAPTNASMTDAIEHAKVAADGVTRSVDHSAEDPAGYPLALQVTAALRTDADKATRQQMADFLAYAGAAGQVPGDSAGQLPAGYAPLPGDLRGELAKARTAVLAGAPAAEPTSSPTGTGSTGSGSGTGSGTTAASGPTSAPAASAAPTADTAPTAASKPTVSPQFVDVAAIAAGARHLLLPGLALLMLLGMLSGPLVLWMGRTGRGPRWLRR